MSKSTIKKFIEGSDHESVNKNDVLKAGDWVLKWDPRSPNDQTGFELYTPKDFDPEKGNGPMGGLILAAVYFLMENGEVNFGQELISRANALSKAMMERNEENFSMNPPVGRTLN